ncbi:MAG TPA: aminotransferase class IV [Thermoanaerobaculia bacterium]
MSLIIPAYWNGRLVPFEEVRIAPDDAGFLFGDGLFETLRVDDGRPRDLSAHLDRLLAGLERLGIAIPESRCDLGRAVTEVAKAAPRPLARLRLTVSRGTAAGPTRLITTSLYEPPGETVTAVLLSDHRIDSRSPVAGLKSLCYQTNRVALREAETRGAFEALLLNEHGRLAEGSRSNVALVFPEGILTPPTGEGCLPGTVRRRLLERGALRERPLALADLEAARGLLLMNSLIGVLPVSRLDGRELPVGPEAARLRRLL